MQLDNMTDQELLRLAARLTKTDPESYFRAMIRRMGLGGQEVQEVASAHSNLANYHEFHAGKVSLWLRNEVELLTH